MKTTVTKEEVVRMNLLFLCAIITQMALDGELTNPVLDSFEEVIHCGFTPPRKTGIGKSCIHIDCTDIRKRGLQDSFTKDVLAGILREAGGKIPCKVIGEFYEQAAVEIKGWRFDFQVTTNGKTPTIAESDKEVMLTITAEK